MKKTQAFLSIGFVVTVALAIGFFIQLQEEKKASVRLENILSAVLKERNAMEIAMNKRLQENEKLISFLTTRLSKEKSINLKLTQNLNRSNKRFQVASQPKKTIELEKIIISSLLEAEGKVLAIDRQNDLVVINLGAVNNLKKGDKLSIYRGDNFVANAELVKVQDRISAAMVVHESSPEGIKVELNDTVK